MIKSPSLAVGISQAEIPGGWGSAAAKHHHLPLPFCSPAGPAVGSGPWGDSRWAQLTCPLLHQVFEFKGFNNFYIQG